MAVSAVLRTGARQFEVGLDEQQRKNDIADAAGQPNGNEEYGKKGKGYTKGYVAGSVHQDVGRRCPGAYKYVCGVREFRSRYKAGYKDAEKSGGVDYIPVFEKTEMEFRMVIGMFTAVKVVVVMSVQVLMGGHV